jgi:2-dehydropantoate 2-reductase
MDAFSQIIVYGAGAIGSYLGMRCSPYATLVARPDHVAAIRSDGLRISGLENECMVPAAAEECPAIAENALVLVAVKMGDVEAAGRDLAPRIRPDTVVAALSNGLDPDRILREILGCPIPRVIVQLGVTLDAPGRISFWGGHLIMGPGAVEDRIVASFKQGGVKVERTEDLDRIVWEKLAINCVANPLSALTGRPNRELVDPELTGLREAIVEEVRRLAATEGVVLPPDLCERIDAALSRSSNRTSMLQDLERRRPTEIEYLNGLVARRLAELGIPAPVNRSLAQMVRMMKRCEMQ